jgi:RNA polymerase sigma-70 factor, ECF subfamily
MPQTVRNENAGILTTEFQPKKRPAPFRRSAYPPIRHWRPTRDGANCVILVGEPLDLEQIAGELYPQLYRYALSLCRDEVEAGDLAQEAFLILARRQHQIRDASKVKFWLFTTLRREFLRGVRHKAAHPSVELGANEAEEPAVPATVAQTADGHTVMEALGRVEEPFRSVLELFYIGDLSYKEIADTLGIPIGTVMSRLSRGKEQLKQWLAESADHNEVRRMSPKSDE